MEIYPCQEAVGNFVEESFQLVRERDRLKDDVRKLQYQLEKASQKIQQMENTKVWKLYKTIKKD